MTDVYTFTILSKRFIISTLDIWSRGSKVLPVSLYKAFFPRYNSPSCLAEPSSCLSFSAIFGVYCICSLHFQEGPNFHPFQSTMHRFRDTIQLPVWRKQLPVWRKQLPVWLFRPYLVCISSINSPEGPNFRPSWHYLYNRIKQIPVCLD